MSAVGTQLKNLNISRMSAFSGEPDLSPAGLDRRE
jgi:hypothetical protein